MSTPVAPSATNRQSTRLNNSSPQLTVLALATSHSLQPHTSSLPTHMPRSKRNKVVSLTKVTRQLNRATSHQRHWLQTGGKGKGAKAAQIELIRRALEEYENGDATFKHFSSHSSAIVFVFAYDNMRTTHIRDIRVAFKESRLFLGKNSVAQVALGRSPEEEVRDNLHHLSKRLEGDTGLLFTSRSRDEVVEYVRPSLCLCYPMMVGIIGFSRPFPARTTLRPEASLPRRSFCIRDTCPCSTLTVIKLELFKFIPYGAFSGGPPAEAGTGSRGRGREGDAADRVHRGERGGASDCRAGQGAHPG